MTKDKENNIKNNKTDNKSSSPIKELKEKVLKATKENNKLIENIKILKTRLQVLNIEEDKMKKKVNITMKRRIKIENNQKEDEEKSSRKEFFNETKKKEVELKKEKNKEMKESLKKSISELKIRKYNRHQRNGEMMKKQRKINDSICVYVKEIERKSKKERVIDMNNEKESINEIKKMIFNEKRNVELKEYLEKKIRIELDEIKDKERSIKRIIDENKNRNESISKVYSVHKESKFILFNSI